MRQPTPRVGCLDFGALKREDRCMARLIRPLIVLTALLAIAASAAVAHTRFYSVGTSFGYDPARKDFLGLVGGGFTTGPCISGRRVRLFRHRPGADRLLGQDRSGSHPGDGPGYWVVAPDGVPPGRYYAVVMRKDLAPGDRHAHICRAYRTAAINVR